MRQATDQRVVDHMRAAKFRYYWTVWDLAIDLKLSRPTIRKALNRLAEAGAVKRHPSHIVSEDHKWSLSDEGQA